MDLGTPWAGKCPCTRLRLRGWFGGFTDSRGVDLFDTTHNRGACGWDLRPVRANPSFVSAAAIRPDRASRAYRIRTAHLRWDWNQVDTRHGGLHDYAGEWH